MGPARITLDHIATRKGASTVRSGYLTVEAEGQRRLAEPTSTSGAGRGGHHHPGTELHRYARPRINRPCAALGGERTAPCRLDHQLRLPLRPLKPIVGALARRVGRCGWCWLSGSRRCDGALDGSRVCATDVDRTTRGHRAPSAVLTERAESEAPAGWGGTRTRWSRLRLVGSLTGPSCETRIGPPIPAREGGEMAWNLEGKLHRDVCLVSSSARATRLSRTVRPTTTAASCWSSISPRERSRARTSPD